MRRLLLFVAAAALAAAALAAAPSAAPLAAPSCDVSGVERTVAIGDVHGAYDRLVEILQATGLVDDRLRWAGGAAHLVQVGDVVDRGPDSRRALDLLDALEEQADKAGGRVHQLLGNHEVMRMLGDMRYATSGEYEAFATAESETMRERFLNTQKADMRADLRRQTPLGWVELRLAFDADGAYGRRLRTLDTVVKINGVVYVHGGISPAVSTMSCSTINETVRRELTKDFAKLAGDPLHSLAAREDGPLWYRGLAIEPDSFASEVDAILARQSATAIVVAHTVTPTGRIVSRFAGKVMQLDTGMQSAYVSGGRASALEHKGGVFTAVYVDRRDALPEASSQGSPSADR